MAAITEPSVTAASAPTQVESTSGVFSDPNRFWLCFWGAALIACLPFLLPYFQSLWRQELYQYFPFVLLAVGYLTWTRWDRVARGPRHWLVWTSVFAGAALLLLGATIFSTWLGNLGFVFLATAFLFSQRAASGKSLGYLAVPLVMLIRVPQLHAQSLVVRLQNVTSQLTALLLDVSGVPQDTYGNIIHLPSKELFVAEACSGIQSAFTMCFLALLIIVWQRRPLVAAPFYVAIALVLAILANTIRVSSVALAEAWYQVDWTTGWSHDLIGYVSLGIAALVLISFDSLAAMVLNPVQIPVGKRGGNPIGILWNWMLGFKSDEYETENYQWNTGSDKAVDEESAVSDSSDFNRRFSVSRPAFAVTAMMGLAAVVMVLGFLGGRGDSRPIVEKDALLFDPPADFLTDRVGVLAIGDREVVRNGSDPQLGLHADVWKCGSAGTVGQLVMSQPYVGWHELCVCYEVQDWILNERYNLPVSIGQPIAVGEFTKGENFRGYLLFTAIDTDGAVPNPPSYTLMGRLFAPFVPLITDDFAETSGSAQTIMLQMWTVSERELSAEELGKLADSIAEVREQARQQIVDHQQALQAG